MGVKKPFQLTRFSCVIVLALSSAAQVVAQTPILGGAKERQPSYGELENFTILSYTDLDGWDQAAEFRVSKDGKHAYISNYQGFSIVDVSDPAKPRVISKVKNHPSVQSQYIDVIGNTLVINQDGIAARRTKPGTAGFDFTISAIRPSRRKWASSKPMLRRGAVSMAFGSMRMPNKASSLSLRRPKKATMTTF